MGDERVPETSALLRVLLGSGCTPESVVDAILADDLALLRRPDGDDDGGEAA